MRLDRDALVRMARTFQTHPETVACRASTRIAAKGSLLASMQRVGRLRALLLGRLGSIGMLRRDTVVDAGGYDPGIAGEDLELVLRLHRHCRDRRLPYRLASVAQPVATTTASQGLRTALAQERRRQRGLIESLARHRGMLFRPRYGAIGWLALPYLSLVASLGLLGAVAGYGAAIAALAIGAVDPSLTVALVRALRDVRAHPVARRAAARRAPPEVAARGGGDRREHRLPAARHARTRMRSVGAAPRLAALAAATGGPRATLIGRCSPRPSTTLDFRGYSRARPHA